MNALQSFCRAAGPAVTDIHISEKGTIYIREYGLLTPAGWSLSSEEIWTFLHHYLTEEKEEYLRKSGSCDTSFTEGDRRFRLHIYRADGGYAAAIRLLPSLEEIGTDPDPDWIESISALRSGLVLVTGSSGSGKTTTLARIIGTINCHRACHIITLEDPTEYLFSPQKSLIHQREIGRDAVDFPSAVRSAMREDPDVIVIGEMRDPETIIAALTAAETGHLVLGTLHCRRAVEAVGRIVHAFPRDKENEARILLSSVLRAVASQTLFRDSHRCILLREILTSVPAISHLIKEQKEEQIPSYMEMGRHYMRTMKQAVLQTARQYGLSPEESEKLLAYIQL